MTDNNKIWLHLIVLAAALTASALLGYLSLILVACAYGIFYYVASRYFSVVAAQSTLFRHFFVFALFTLYSQFIIILSWLISRNFPLDATPVLILTSALVAWVVLYKSKARLYTISNRFVTKTNIVAIAITVLSLIILVLPSLITTGLTSKSSVLQAINGNIDDAAHVALLNDRIQFNRAVGQKSIVEEKGRIVSLYPVGWHSINGLLIKSIVPDISTGIPTVFAYILTKLFWFGALIFLISDLSLNLVARYTKFSTWRGLVATSPILLLMSVVVVAQLFRDGFYSFVPLLIASIGVVYVIYWAYAIPDSANKRSLRIAETLTLATLLSIGGSMSWILVLPGFALFILLLLLDGRSLLHKNLLVITRFAPFLFFAVASIVAQYLIMSIGTSVGGISFLQGLMLDGGVTRYLPLFYALVIISIATGVSVIARKDRNTARQLLLYIGAIFALLAFVNLAQQFIIDMNAYYYHKMLFVLLAVATPLVVLGGMYVVAAINTTRLAPIAASVMLVFTFLLLFGVEPAERRAFGIAPYIAGKRVVGSEHNETIYQILRTKAGQDKYYDKHLWFAYEPGETEKNEIITMMLINKPFSSCFNEARTSFITKRDFRAPVEVISKHCSDYRVTVVTASGYTANFRSIVTHAQIQDRVSVKSYDDIVNGT